jgi:hypothetical protein
MNNEEGPEREPSKEWLPWLGPLLLLVSVGLLAKAAYTWWPRTVDDAFITFRYAQNLAEGFGPVYNLGERVEGYSSPIWMFGSAAAISVGLDPVVVSKWAGLIAAGALAVAVYVALRASGMRGWGAGLATCAVGGSLVLQLWSTSGMESSAYAALFFVGLAIASCAGQSVRGALWASAFLVAASLTRPEGMMFWALGFASYLVGVRAHPRRLLAYALPDLALALYFAWRLYYYHSPLPNTYYVKTGGGPRMWDQGLLGFTTFLSEPAIAILMSAALAGLVVGLARRETRRAAAMVGAATLVHMFWVVSVGDDGLFRFRFYVPIVGTTAFLAGLLFYDPGAAPLSRAERRRAERKGSSLSPRSLATPRDATRSRASWARSPGDRYRRADVRLLLSRGGDLSPHRDHGPVPRGQHQARPPSSRDPGPGHRDRCSVSRRDPVLLTTADDRYVWAQRCTHRPLPISRGCARTHDEMGQ